MEIMDIPFDDSSPARYFKRVEKRIARIGISKAALAREMLILPEQLTRYMNTPRPNPTLRTVVAIERALFTLEARMSRVNLR